MPDSTEATNTKIIAEPKQERVVDNFDKESRAVEVFASLQKLASETGERRKLMRRGQIQTMSQDGHSPISIFSELQGDYSRADNPGCGINGEADHATMTNYLNLIAETHPNTAEAQTYKWLGQKSNELTHSRKVVKDFLLLDQLTNSFLLAPKTELNDNNMVVNSSLGDIAERQLTVFADQKLTEQMQTVIQEVRTWQDLSDKLTQASKELGDFLPPKWMKKFDQEFTADGDLEQSWLKMKTALDQPEDWIADLAKFQASGDLTSESASSEFAKAMEKFMEGLTGAQYIIETKFYLLGMGRMGQMKSMREQDLPASAQ